jgi:hypothetical protein
MKLELVKEVRNGETYYYTERDGQYISGSVYFNLEDAENYFTKLKEACKVPDVKEVIKSTEI